MFDQGPQMTVELKPYRGSNLPPLDMPFIRASARLSIRLLKKYLMPRLGRDESDYAQASPDD